MYVHHSQDIGRYSRVAVLATICELSRSRKDSVGDSCEESRVSPGLGRAEATNQSKLDRVFGVLIEIGPLATVAVKFSSS